MNFIKNALRNTLGGASKLPMESAPTKQGQTLNSVFFEALNNTKAVPQDEITSQIGQLGQPKMDLPRWTEGKDFAPSSMTAQAKDNINTNKQAVRNVSSDDWFHINSRPNYKDFF